MHVSRDVCTYGQSYQSSVRINITLSQSMVQFGFWITASRLTSWIKGLEESRAKITCTSTLRNAQFPMKGGGHHPLLLKEIAENNISVSGPVLANVLRASHKTRVTVDFYFRC